jgi:hypothetical protein
MPATTIAISDLVSADFSPRLTPVTSVSNRTAKP